ncbi:MAG: hypothetical protein CSA21_01630 [Deltaproteobacteria bacterium]|nr:MAG: hypothetical protein CSA21_01630 [Deltaproteobacteria bacterium]
MNDNSITIRSAESFDHESWDEFILTHPDASPYHLFAWRKAIESAYGHPCTYLYYQINNEINGVLPIVHLHFPMVKNEMVSLPFCDVGNCIADDEEIQDSLLNELFNLLKKSRIGNFQIRGDLKPSDFVQSQLQRVETGKVRMFLDLPESAEVLLKSFKSKLRSQIRKAEKNGLVFEWGCIDDIDKAYYVFSKNMRELGSPVHSKRFLRSVLENYGDRAKLGLTKFEDKFVGMGIILLGGQSVSIPWASTLREYNRLGPNMLLYWNFLKYSADNGYNYFDFGRSSEGEGTYRFKKQWGAEPISLYWYELRHGLTARSKQDATGSRKREFAEKIWRNLPLGVANAFGPYIRKYISL